MSHPMVQYPTIDDSVIRNVIAPSVSAVDPNITSITSSDRITPTNIVQNTATSEESKMIVDQNTGHIIHQETPVVKSPVVSPVLAAVGSFLDLEVGAESEKAEETEGETGEDKSEEEEEETKSEEEEEEK